ncbi:MAG: NAD-binding protein [Clostridiales bacterium]|jgi:trk system potassium uptake protein TrkA|nr:NAD-binding protein [Clostridiales bacterium]
MKIAIVGAGKKVDYLVSSLKDKKHQIVVIDNNEDDCNNLSRTFNIDVILGDGSKPFVLEDAGVHGYDLLIALTPKDSHNLVICQLAKKAFGIRRAFATVTNPKNVSVFQKLGINTVISDTHIVAQIIEQMASVEEVVNFLPLEDGKIQLIEYTLMENNKIIGESLANIGFPATAVIGCIMRNGAGIIPNGETIFERGDRLIMLCTNEGKNDTLKFFKKASRD